MAEIKPSEISKILKQQLEGIKSSVELEEVGTVLQVGDGRIGLSRNRNVNKLEQDARDELQHDQDDGHPAQTPAQGELQCRLRHRCRTEVQEEVFENELLAVPFRSWVDGIAENRRPYAAEESGWVFGHVPSEQICFKRISGPWGVVDPRLHPARNQSTLFCWVC